LFYSDLIASSFSWRKLNGLGLGFSQMCSLAKASMEAYLNLQLKLEAIKLNVVFISFEN
jgi:hypothetical protein